MFTMQQLHEYKTNERFLKNKKFSRLPKLAVYRKSEWIFKVKRKNCISVGPHKTWAKFYKCIFASSLAFKVQPVKEAIKTSTICGTAVRRRGRMGK